MYSSNALITGVSGFVGDDVHLEAPLTPTTDGLATSRVSYFDPSPMTSQR